MSYSKPPRAEVAKFRFSKKGLAWAFIAVTIWAGSLVLLKAGVETGLTAHDLAALRFATAALCLLPVLFRRGWGLGNNSFAGLARMVCGFGAPYIVILSIGLQTASASAAGIVNPGAMAVFAALFVHKDGLEPLSKRGIIGILIVSTGVALACFLPGPPTLGHGLFIATGFLWAVYTATVKRLGVDALHATALVAVWSALIYLPIYVMLLPKAIFVVPLHVSFIQSIFQGLGVSVIAVFAFTRSVELLGTVTGATLPALIPIVTVGLSLLTLAQTPNWYELGPATMVGLGVALILRPHRAGSKN